MVGKTVFFSFAFSSPVEHWVVVGKKYTKSGDVILVIQQPRGSLLPGWVGLPPPGEIRGKKTRRKKVDASDTGGTRERRVNALTFGAQRKKTRKNPFIQSTKWPQVGS